MDKTLSLPKSAPSSLANIRQGWKAYFVGESEKKSFITSASRGAKCGRRYMVRFEGTRKVCEFSESDIIGPGETVLLLKKIFCERAKRSSLSIRRFDVRIVL